MTPTQIHYTKGFTLEEFYWAGRTVVYVNDRRVSTNLQDTIKDIEAGRDPRYSEGLIHH